MRLKTLKDRRIRGDFVEIYNLVNEQGYIDWVNFSNLRSDLELTRSAKRIR